MSWTFAVHNFNSSTPVVGALSLVYTAQNTFVIFVNDERIPSMQNTELAADPVTGKVVGFLEGAFDSAVSGRYYVTSESPWTTWTEYDCTTIPVSWHGAGNYTGAGLALHSNGDWTCFVPGPGAVGSCYSTDDGATWVRESPLLRMNNVWGQMWSPAVISDTQVTFAGRSTGVTKVYDFNPSSGAYTDQGSLGTLFTSWHSLYKNGRRFYGNVDNGDILEFTAGPTVTTTTGGYSRAPWVYLDDIEGFITVDKADQGQQSDIYYRLHDISGAAHSSLSATEYTITTSFADILPKTTVCGAGNGVFIMMAFERINNNESTVNAVLFWSTDGIDWSDEQTVTLPSRPHDFKGVTNEGTTSKLVWVGGTTWLFMYRGIDNINRVCKFDFNQFGY